MWCRLPCPVLLEEDGEHKLHGGYGRVTRNSDVTRLGSSSRAPSLAPSPLRTGLKGFPFIRLEHSKTPPEQRGRGLIQNEEDLHTTTLMPSRTTEGMPPAVCEAAPMANWKLLTKKRGSSTQGL